MVSRSGDRITEMDVNPIELERIEADVVIVVTVHDNDVMDHAVFPIWECNETIGAVRARAAQMALATVEQAGSGYATVRVYDFRTPDVQ